MTLLVRSGGASSHHDTDDLGGTAVGGSLEIDSYQQSDHHALSSYNNKDNNNNNNNNNHSSLSVFQGAALLTADCLGTGILALPADMIVLGRTMGLAFLILNIPINLYAGTILSHTALYVEKQQQQQQPNNGDDDDDDNNTNDNDDDNTNDEHNTTTESSKTTSMTWNKQRTYECITQPQQQKQQNDDDDDDDDKINSSSPSSLEVFHDEPKEHKNNDQHHATTAHTSANAPASVTFDYISLTQTVFPPSHHHDNNDNTTTTTTTPTAPLHQYSNMTCIVIGVYYTNLFLILGDYILVMSHAVRAMMGSSATGTEMCIPTAGFIASTLMFGISQLRTMAHLGRTVSYISLAALFIVVFQCLVGLRQQQQQQANDYTTTTTTTIGGDDISAIMVDDTISMTTMTTTTTTLTLFLSKVSAMASIGFATGSQKLLLNIRHDMTHKTKAPMTLAMSLLFYGTAYLIICILAGPNPPSFLFDAIPLGSNHNNDIGRRMGGFLLWIHVAVSYAINSQAICSSMDRLFFQPQQQPQQNQIQLQQQSSSLFLSSIRRCFLPFQQLIQHQSDAIRWMILTFGISVSSYMVANAIPFFKDLVSLIGAFTSIPLTLVLPAILYRKVYPLILQQQQQQQEDHLHDSKDDDDDDDEYHHDNRIQVVQSRRQQWWWWWFRKCYCGGSNSTSCTTSCTSGIGTTWSLALLIFSIVFTVLGLIGALSEIELDWINQGTPFACS